MMEEQKAKVVFEFGRSEYDAYLFLAGQKQTEETEEIWKAMVADPVAANIDLFEENSQAVKLMVMSVAILSVKNKVKQEP